MPGARTRGARGGRSRGLLLFGQGSASSGSGADTLAPILSGQTVGSITAEGGVPAVDTNEGRGTLWVVVVPDADVPSIAQIKAGLQSDGSAALAAQSKQVVSPVTQTFTAVTGLAAATAYDAWFVQMDFAFNNSTAVKADFTTSA